MFKAIIYGVLIASSSSLALAQQGMTVGEASDARKRAGFSQLQQADLQQAGSCYLVAKTVNGLDPRAQKDVLGDAVVGNPEQPDSEAFWLGFLTRLGVDQASIDGAAAQANQHLSNFATLGEAERAKMVAVFKRGVADCRPVQDFLEKNRCPEGRAGDAPPATYIPARALYDTQICREIIAKTSRGEPAQWVKESPEDLARFESEREADRTELAFYDKLLAQQPVPQCPIKSIGGVFTGFTMAGGTMGYETAYNAVDKAYKEFLSKRDRGNYSNDAMVAAAQLDYIKWQRQCRDLEMLLNADF